MSALGVRPHFLQTLDLAVEEAQARLTREVERCEDCCEMKVFPGFICLRIPEGDRHFWSPRLNLGLEATDDGRTRIEGIYGPNANVWSLFLYGYLLSGSFALFSGILGFVQRSLGRPAWGLWIFALSAGAMVALYVMARIGRRIGESQTLRLHRIYEAAVGRSVPID
jgi:hypothetical protein